MAPGCWHPPCPGALLAAQGVWGGGEAFPLLQRWVWVLGTGLLAPARERQVLAPENQLGQETGREEPGACGRSLAQPRSQPLARAHQPPVPLKHPPTHSWTPPPQGDTRTDLPWVRRGSLWRLTGTVQNVSIQPCVQLRATQGEGQPPTLPPGRLHPGRPSLETLGVDPPRRPCGSSWPRHPSGYRPANAKGVARMGGEGMVLGWHESLGGRPSPGHACVSGSSSSAAC